MMTQINLLPWREQARHIKKMRFLITIGGFVILTLVLVLFVHIFFKNAIRHQQKRNTFLQTQISQSQTSYTELEKNKAAQDLTLEKIGFLVGLQNKSYRAVKLFNELPKIVPENVTLIKMKREGNSVYLQGTAPTNLDITALMKNLTRSKVLVQPDLNEISAKDATEENQKMFELKVVQKE
jgi:type IV pilus assembly protein PilN